MSEIDKSNSCPHKIEAGGVRHAMGITCSGLALAWYGAIRLTLKRLVACNIAHLGAFEVSHKSAMQYVQSVEWKCELVYIFNLSLKRLRDVAFRGLSKSYKGKPNRQNASPNEASDNDACGLSVAPNPLFLHVVGICLCLYDPAVTCVATCCL